MTLSFSPFFPQSIINYGLANAACTAQQNVVVGGVNGTKVETMVATSNDTIDHLLTFSLNISGTLYQVGSVLVAANTGNLTANQNGINILASNAFPFLPQDPNGNKYIYLSNAACSISVKANSVSNNALGFVSVSGQGASF
jgi:hypothetical protein